MATLARLELTHGQRRVLVALEVAIEQMSPVLPSLREIADVAGLNVKRVHTVVGELERKGAVKRTPHISRSIQIVAKKRKDNWYLAAR